MSLPAHLQPLAAHVTGAEIDREERKGKGASDHAPVFVDLGLHPDRVAPLPLAPDPEPVQGELWSTP